MIDSKPLVDVSLILQGEELDPVQVTALLKVNGTKMRRKGEKWRTSNNNEVTSKTGVWALDAYRDSMDLHDQISSLRQQLSNSKCEPLRLPGVQSAVIDMFIAFGSSERVDDNYECQLTSDDLKWISGLGVPVSFTISYVPS